MGGIMADAFRRAGITADDVTLLARRVRVEQGTSNKEIWWNDFYREIKRNPALAVAMFEMTTGVLGAAKTQWWEVAKLGGAGCQSRSAPDAGSQPGRAAAPSTPVTEFGEGEGQAVPAPQDGGQPLSASSSPAPDARDAHTDRDGGGQRTSASDEGQWKPAPSVSTPSVAGGQRTSASDEGQDRRAPAGGPLKPVWPTIHSPPDGPRPSAVRYSTPPSLRPARPPVQRMPQAHQRRPEVQASKGDTWFRKLDIDIEGKRIGDRRVGDLLRIFDNTQGNWHRSRRAYESQIEDAKSQIKSAERSIAFKDQKEAFVRKLVKLAGLKPDDFITERSVTPAHIKAAWTYAEELYSAKAA